MRRLLQRYGVIGATIFTTLVCIGVFLVITILSRLVFRMPILVVDLVVAVLVPLMLALPLSYYSYKTVDELTDAGDKLEKLATIDPLTGIMNRATFIRTAEDALMTAPDVQPVGMVVMDIDRFKLINDTYGHLVGDEALRLIARTISVHLREGDIFGRFGGDEFILLTPNTSGTEIQELCHILLTHIQTLSVGIGDVRTRLSSTMGVTSAVPSAASLNDLIARADAALLHAKRQGGGRVRYN